MKKRTPNEEALFVGELTRFQTQLRAYIISLMPGMSGAADVLQETNLILWEKREKFEPGTNFKAWAFAIARLEVKAHRRKMYQFGTVTLDEKLAEHLAEPLQDSQQTPDELLQALDHCLSRLNDTERQLIEHRYFTKSTLEVFASARGSSVETLRNNLYRIRAALRKCVKDRIMIEEVGR